MLSIPCFNFTTVNILGARKENQYHYGHYNYFGEYPIPIPLNPTEKTRCLNSKIKDNGNQFVVQRSDQKNPRDPNSVAFFASVKEDGIMREGISFLNSEIEGECNDVETPQGSSHCGLAKYLVATCFQDDLVLGEDGRGLEPNTFEIKHPLIPFVSENPKLRNDALEHCQTITFLQCQPQGETPKRACVAYLRAGSISKFDILFSVSDDKTTAMKLGNALETKFSKDANDFVAKYGMDWFFCKCNDTSKVKCKIMLIDNN